MTHVVRAMLNSFNIMVFLIFPFFSFYIWIFFTHLFISETFTEVKVVAVFDAMMSGLPTHKEDFNGYCFWTQGTIPVVVTNQWKSWLVLWFFFLLFFFLGEEGRVKLHLVLFFCMCMCMFVSVISLLAFNILILSEFNVLV